MAADAHALTLAIRTLHVLAGTILLGGPLVVLALALKRDADPHAVTAAAAAHEWLAWPALGLIVLSGVGNLGAFGDSVPPLATPWGRAFLVKLALVLVLVLVAAARTVAVTRARAGSPLPRRFTVSAFSVTAALAAGILALAVTLAHG